MNMAQKFKTFPYFNLSRIFCFTNFMLVQFSRYFTLENFKEQTKSDDVWLCTSDMSREFEKKENILSDTAYILGQKDFSFSKFDSFLAGLGRNWVYGACCPAQMAQNPV